MKNYDIILLERPDALSFNDLLSLTSFIHTDVVLLDIQSDKVESYAMGVITAEAAEQLNYDFDNLKKFVQNILNDMKNETPDSIYHYKENEQTFTMLLTRNLPTPNTKTINLQITFTDLKQDIVQLTIPENTKDEAIKYALHITNEYLFDIDAYQGNPSTEILMNEICSKHPWSYQILKPDITWCDNDKIIKTS